MTIITVANLKGGCGKTNLCSNLGAALAEQRHRVLLIDLDKQGNLTSIYERVLAEEPTRPNDEHPNIATVLFRALPLSAAVVATDFENLFLAPADMDLMELDAHFQNDLNAPFLLAELLEAEKTRFDYVIIDTPPHLDLATRMALVAAHSYVIPLDAHRFSFKGSQRLQDVVRDIRKRANPKLKFLGYVLSRVQARRNLTEQNIASLKEQFGRELAPTQIKESIKYQEASTAGKPITAYAPKSDLADAFRQLAKDLKL